MIMVIPNSVKKYREAAGLTQDKLGALIGTSPQQIARLENGTRKLSHEWLTKLTSALGVSPAHLLRNPDIDSENSGQFVELAPEVLLMRIFSKMPPDMQTALLDISIAYARAAKIADLDDIG